MARTTPPTYRDKFGSAGKAGMPAVTTIGTGRHYVARFDALIEERLLRPDKYFTHMERFERLPLLNASNIGTTTAPTATQMALMQRRNPNLESLGNNHVDANVDFLNGGGIRYVTAGADGDECILLAHLDTLQTSLASDANGGVGWDSRNQLLMVMNLVTGPDAADITNCIIWGGWKLTNVEVTATDADQAFFRFEDGVAGGSWQAVTSVGGTDDADNTGLAVAAATNYQLIVHVDQDRVPRYYINDELVQTGDALTALGTFNFYIGVAADGNAQANQLDIRNFMVSQLYG